MGKGRIGLLKMEEGESEMIEQVKDAMLLATIGVVLGLGAWGLLWLVALELSHVHG